jgi:diguanylate cyclase (GGDEF)-like protein/PAS domain S-box-containing protein
VHDLLNLKSDMISPDNPLSSEHAQLARLEQFLNWAILLDFTFVSFQVIAFLLFSDLSTGSTAAVMFAYGVVLLIARGQTRQGKLHRSVMITCNCLFAADIMIALIRPTLWPTLAFVPLLGLAVTLPYVGGRALRRLIGIAELTIAVIVLCGFFVTAPSYLPQWFANGFLFLSLLAVAALVLLLLWQFSTRLTDTLNRTRAAEERYSLAARGANDGLWDWDLTTDQIYYSTRWKEMLGCTDADITTAPEEWFGRVHPDDRARLEAEIGVHRDGLTPHFASEHRMIDAFGNQRWMLSRGLAIFDANGKAIRIAGSQTDITVRKQVEQQLSHDAHHDVLTGLPNRALFMDRLERALKRARRQPEYHFAVLYLDLDRFKVVNDSLGHRTGDELLVELGQRLLSSVRPDDTVARLGGDEFGILLDGVSDLQVATLAADRIMAHMEAPFILQSNEVFSGISVGIAYSTADYEVPDQVLRDADIALYRAKAMGRSRHVVFATAMHARAVEQLQVEMDLRRAIERQEFVVYYQPIIALQTGQISSFEALVRWQHPRRGLIGPGEFLHIAEETGLIAPIGWIVLREACRQIRVWQAHFPWLSSLAMSVNVSGTQLAHPDFTTHVSAILRDAGIDGRQLNLEITEAVMTERASGLTDVLAFLKMRGIPLHIDDFGTGYSSLSTLHDLPINTLKIDRSFVSRMGSNGENAEMIVAIITLAHNLGLEVVAEGVETKVQREQLRMLGCDYAQGYLFSRPADAFAAAALLAESRDTSVSLTAVELTGESKANPAVLV